MPALNASVDRPTGIANPIASGSHRSVAKWTQKGFRLLKNKVSVVSNLFYSSRVEKCIRGRNVMWLTDIPASPCWSVFSQCAKLSPRAKHPILDTRISCSCCSSVLRQSRSGDPPWILKRGGLESSGWRLISSIGQTKGIVFFSAIFFLLLFKDIRVWPDLSRPPRFRIQGG